LTARQVSDRTTATATATNNNVMISNVNGDGDGNGDGNGDGDREDNEEEDFQEFQRLKAGEEKLIAENEALKRQLAAALLSNGDSDGDQWPSFCFAEPFLPQAYLWEKETEREYQNIGQDDEEEMDDSVIIKKEIREGISSSHELLVYATMKSILQGIEQNQISIIRGETPMARVTRHLNAVCQRMCSHIDGPEKKLYRENAINGIRQHFTKEQKCSINKQRKANEMHDLFAKMVRRTMNALYTSRRKGIKSKDLMQKYVKDAFTKGGYIEDATATATVSENFTKNCMDERLERLADHFLAVHEYTDE